MAASAWCDAGGTGGGIEDRFRVLTVARPAPRGILALGGELKASICLYSGCQAALSEPLGNLPAPAAYRAYVAFVDEARRRFSFSPEIVACDLHPRYLSTKFAVETGLPAVRVQHHHAHLVSVMAEWSCEKPVVGVCCDGVGYGVDGAAWGGEVLHCGPSGFERVGHLDYFPLIGGDAAAVDTTRPAAALLRQAFGATWREHLPPSLAAVPPETLETYEHLMARPAPSLLTSSLGRVFDGISCLAGLCLRNEREAQAAIALDTAASNEPVEPYPYGTTAENGSIKMSIAPMVRAIVQEVRSGVTAATVSARFHETIARLLATTAELACERCGTGTVVLSGGCFANRRLLTRLTERLERRRLRVLSPRLVSCGDAALSLGQAVAAAAMVEGAGSCAWQSPAGS